MPNIPTIIDVIDHERGCGKRKPGGLYLRSDNFGSSCGKLPLPLSVCPCCSAGVKPSRGWTWIDATKLFEGIACRNARLSTAACGQCPLNEGLGKAGLLWVGEGFYKTPEIWIQEAMEFGISRRIAHIPIGFKLRETWVLMAHRKAITDYSVPNVVTLRPGVFQIFLPTRIEYVVSGKETQEQLCQLEKQGVTLVRVRMAEDFLT